MAYLADKKPGELTALTSLATDDVIVVGDTSDASEVAKYITKANLITDLTTSFATALGADDNYVTDAEKTVIGNTSGTNTGDNATNTQYSGLAASKLDANTPITGATKTKITYDADGLVTAGADATTADIAASTDKNYVTDAQAVVIGNTSGTNTGDQTLPTKASLGLDTTDSPQFAGVNIGHATDTTLSRVSAGVIAVEGVNVLTTAGGTLTGNITLGENTSIDLDPAGSADGKYSGICITGTAGAALAFGDLIYLAVADSRWELTDADATATAGTPLIGMCVLAAAGDGSATKILLQGTIRADSKFPALTIGAPAYVGETAGAIQVAIPTGADNVIRVVGRALTADELYFCPSQDHQITVA